MNKEILRLAIPNILSNISVPLMSSVDTYLMGQLSAAHLGAIGIGSMIFNFLYWNFGFLRMGTTGLVAQAYGQNDSSLWSTHFLRGILVALSVAALLVVLQRPIIHLGLEAFQVLPDQTAMVSEYFLVRVWAAPAALLLMVLMGWSFGMQNAWIPLIVTIIINALNIMISYLFVAHLDYGIYGVALGTVIAQYLGVFVLLLLIIRRYHDKLQWINDAFTVRWSAWADYFTINRDIFLRTICLTLVFAFFYRASSSSDDTILLAVNVILLQLLNWMSYGVDGFAYAAESLAGKYYGRKDKQHFNRMLKYVAFWSCGLGLLYSAVYGLLGTPIVSIFADQDPSIIAMGETFLFWMIIMPIVGIASYIWDGVFVGITASRTMRNAMFLSLIVFASTYMLTRAWENHGLWFSLMMFLLARGIIQTIQYQRKGWDLR